MNRATFFQRLVLFFTALSGPFALTTANTKQGEASNVTLKSLWKLRNFAVEGSVHHEKDRIMVHDPIEFDMLLPGHTAISMDQVSRDLDKGIEIISYTILQRREGVDYQWTEPYTFFAEREVGKSEPIQLEYR